MGLVTSTSVINKWFKATLVTTPLFLLCIHFYIILYMAHQPNPTNGFYETTSSIISRCAAESPPSLAKLLGDVADVLDEAKVTYWLLPSIGLLPSKRAKSGVLGKLSPWQEGVDIGIFQEDEMRMIVAQTELQPLGMMHVESYFGLRLFPASGLGDDRYDFRSPFIDIVYFSRKEEHIVSYCCDCAPITIGPCTKKTCGCLVCPAPISQVFPLASVRIESVGRKISAPRNTSLLMLPRNIPRVDPLIFQT